MDLYVLRLAEDGAAVRNGKMRVGNQKLELVLGMEVFGPSFRKPHVKCPLFVLYCIFWLSTVALPVLGAGGRRDPGD